MRSPSPRGCARGFGVGLLGAASGYDLLLAVHFGHGVWFPVIVLLAGFAAVLWPAGRRPPWLTEQVRTVVPAAVSVLYTGGVLLTGRPEVPFGPGEAAVLLALLFVAVRHCPWPWALWCAVLDAAALLLLPVRYFRALPDEALALIVIGLVLAGGSAGLAAYLRSLDYRRTVAVGDTRRAERVAIAADLHDFVAHHVTGILVQTQMARMMADRPQPRELDPVLAGIEWAATEALASMRRTVGVLRDTGPRPPTAVPSVTWQASPTWSRASRAPSSGAFCTATRRCPTPCRTKCRRRPSGSSRRR
ncbi:histidine kinase dimerization/phosphoacceptor domain-containing protein [Streptomyces sp. A244]|uniref:histidine kinase dimerization/phosphoacceptor domain-containing protein n=1 Tax=Streptomyces sp. A244 TaxID=2137016 RepID=UPI0026AAA0BA|nr:histidine kinase dimerization/phosphoacceptor domain-containing protein [Streptomyces sp. A244]